MFQNLEKQLLLLTVTSLFKKTGECSTGWRNRTPLQFAQTAWNHPSLLSHLVDRQRLLARPPCNPAKRVK